MYRIGEFSKIVDLSIRTLRYYDEINILKPGYVDNFSNYRYYTDQNIEEARLIIILRSVGFSLEEILMYKDNLNEEVIDQKISSLYSEMDELSLKIKKLEIIKEEVNTSTLPKDNIHVLERKIHKFDKAA